MHALRGVDVDLPAGRFTAIMGPSGSGKSTLMHCLAGLDQPTAGTVTVAGTALESLDDDALTIFRREHLGFVFQSFNLLPMLTAGQNILLPLELAGRPVDRDRYEALRGHARPLRPARPPALRAVRRPAAAGRDRPRADHPSRTSSSPTSRPATSTARPRRRCSTTCAAACASSARPSSW